MSIQTYRDELDLCELILFGQVLGQFDQLIALRDSVRNEQYYHDRTNKKSKQNIRNR